MRRLVDMGVLPALMAKFGVSWRDIGDMPWCVLDALIEDLM